MSILNTDTQSLIRPPKPVQNPVDPTQLRDFGDPDKTRTAIYDSVLNATRGIQPLANPKHTLVLRDVDYDDPGHFSLKQQKDAILTGKTLGRRLVGTWELRDNATGTPLDSKRMTLAKVPFLTDRGTFIHNGSEYTLANQMRLRPGIFTRVKDNGEIEAHANLIPGKGASHRYFLDPSKGVFYVKFGQAKIPLMPLVKALGAKDADLQKLWGNELWQANAQKNDPGALNKIFAKLVRKGDINAPAESKYKAIKDAIERMEVDPDVTRRTLGVAIKNLNLDGVLATTKKLLDVSRGEADVDDRDHLAFQNIYGPEDLLAERISKDSGGIRRALFYKSSFKNNLSSMQPGLLTKQLEAALLHSGLGQNLEEINLAEVLDKQAKVTRLGDGGIASLDAIPDEARSVQPSHFGMIDPVRTPECETDASEVMTSTGWKHWSTVTDDDSLACLINGKLEFHKPIKLISSDYDGLMIGGVTPYVEFLVTPNHRMYVKSDNRNSDYVIELAGNCVNKKRNFMTGGHSPCDGRRAVRKTLYEYGTQQDERRAALDFDYEDWCEFVGLVLAAGRWRSDNKTDNNYLTVARNVRPDTEHYTYVDNLLQSLKLPFVYGNNTFTVENKTLVDYFLKLDVEEDKHIPRDILNSHVDARKRCVRGILRGCIILNRSVDQYQPITDSKALADDIQFLLFTLGVASKISSERVTRDGRQQIAYTVNIHEKQERRIDNRQSEEQGWRTSHYTGKVYCAQVPGGLIFTRHNGKTGFWKGNSFRTGVDAFMSGAARKGKDNRIYAPFIDKKGQLVWKSPQDLADMTVTDISELKRNTKRVGAMRGGKLTFVPRDQVDLTLPNFENAFSPLGNMIPMKSAVKAQRMAMASRMTTQALPLDGAEAPFVRTGMFGDPQNSYEKRYGKHMGAIFADKDGTVLGVDKDKIRIKYDDGSVAEKELYKSFPSNRKTFTENEAVVTPGQRITAGQALAKSNYTDKEGVTALGKNLHVGYLPYKGYNFEDAIVISESAAKKMTSQHMYQHGIDWTSDHKQGKAAYVSMFANKYDRKTLDKIDDDGVVKEGTVINFGDPIVLAAKRKELTYGKVHKQRQAAYSDSSEVWEHHSPGVVTDVLRTPKGTKVLVKSLSQMEVGDKMCFDPETDLLTRRGWKPVYAITMLDELATLNTATDELEYHKPTHLYAYNHTGQMYYLNTKHVNMLVTLNHRLWVSRPGKQYEAVTAEDFYKSVGAWQFKKDCKWSGQDLPTIQTASMPNSVSTDLWVELLGYYLADGKCKVTKSGSKTVSLRLKPNSPYGLDVGDCLTKLGLSFTSNESKERYDIHDSWLCDELSQLGSKRTKFVPDYVQELSTRQLSIFMHAYVKARGACDGAKCWEYIASSEQLAADLQTVCLKLGWSVKLKVYSKVVDGNKTVTWRGRINKKHLRPWWKKCLQRLYPSVKEDIVDYSGRVYSITVPNHVVYCRRDDKTYWSHNSGRYGDKGVVAAIVPDEQMPQDSSGKSFEVLLNPLGVISRCYDEHTEFLTKRGWVFGRDVRHDDVFLCFNKHNNELLALPQSAPFHEADYAGEMFYCEASSVDFAVTPGHKMWAKCDHTIQWQEVPVERIAFHRSSVPTVGGIVAGELSNFVLPQTEHDIADTQSDRDEIVIDAGDWADFLGRYAADGHIVFEQPTDGRAGEYKVCIPQDDFANPSKYETIAKLLDRLPFGWFYDSSTQQFVINSKRLALHMQLYGNRYDKYIDEWVFAQPAAVRQRFLDAFCLSDVSTTGSTSERLIDDLQRLWIYQGVAAIKREVPVCEGDSPLWRCVVMPEQRDQQLDEHDWHKADYAGKVYCPTVPTGYVLTRRNGKILVAGNTNPAQMVEAALGKIAAKTGKHYNVSDFDNIDDLTDFAMAELKKHNMSDLEDVIDPETGRKIPQVFTGNRFFMKLHHTSESKAQGRGTGGYSMDATPAKGGATGSKRISLLDNSAILAHGATEVLRDAGAIRGQRNEEFWLPFMQGLPSPKPKVPFIYQKFVNELQAAGINVIRDGHDMHVMAMTDKDIDTLAGQRYITSGETVKFEKGMKPVPGGLFDPTLTGGNSGNRWSAIKLEEPMPNPVMEEPIRRLLGLTQKDFESVLAGKKDIAGHTGPKAIAQALSLLNVDKEIAVARESIKNGRATHRDAAVRRLSYLKEAKKLDIHPKDWVLKQAPVLPPIFRPVAVMSDNKMPLVADANYLYKELIEANDNLREMRKEVDDVGDERLALYKTFKAVTGLGDPVHPKLQEKQVKGILKHIFGSSPKFGSVQRRLISSTVDLVGRSVITPNPDLDMDQVGLPEERAWDIYKNFIVRRLKRRGLPLLEAAKQVQNKTALAKSEMLAEMKDRPVIINRAPVLHKFGIMAFYPKLVKGHTLEISPLVVKGFNADFDGDAMQYHVPVSDEAKTEAIERMLPSRNLLSPADLKSPVHIPSQEYTGGLYAATSKSSGKKPQVFRSLKDAAAAYERGQLDINDPVEILS